MIVKELNKEQLSELKQFYVLESKGLNCDLSYEELVEAENIPDDDIYEYYANETFVNDDFFCSQEV